MPKRFDYGEIGAPVTTSKPAEPERTPDEWYEHARVLLHEKEKPEEALEAYRRGIALDSSDAMLLAGEGEALEVLGRDTEAVEAYRRATVADPEYALAWCNMGFALNRLGQHREALEALEKGYAVDEDDDAIVYNLACTWCHLGDKAKTLEFLARSIELDESNRELAQEDSELDSLRGDEDFERVLALE